MKIIITLILALFFSSVNALAFRPGEPRPPIRFPDRGTTGAGGYVENQCFPSVPLSELGNIELAYQNYFICLKK